MSNNKKYVSLNRLQTFLENLSNKFASLTHKHTLSDLTDYEIDNSLSPTSTNPVQNKAIDAEFDAIATAMNALELAVDGKSDSDHIHDDRYYTETEIDQKLANKSDSTHNHDDKYDAKGAATTAASTALDSAKYYTDTKTSGLASTTVVDNKISTHNTSTAAHSDIRELISGLTTRLNTLANSDDTTLDQMSEIVAYIKNNKSLIDGVTTSKVNVTDIIDNLTTNVTNKPLSAAQGVAIKGLIDALQEDLDSHTHTVSDITDVTATATELNYMDGVTSSVQTQLDGKANAFHIHPYGVCNSGDFTKAKTVTVDNNFSLVEGARVLVKFAVANRTTSPTLNVNNTGAKPIMRYGDTAAGTIPTTTSWEDGAIIPFTYDGTNWVQDYWYNTTYSNADLGQGLAYCYTTSGTELTAGLYNYNDSEGGIVSVNFTYDVPASATLNINSQGARQIYYKGEAIPKGLIEGGDTATFIYANVKYHLLSIDRWHDDIASLKSDVGKKSDWNQNNSYEADYIKNRTHYTEPQLSTVLAQKTVSNGNSLNELGYTTPSSTYIVTVDGTKYQCDMWVNTYGENCYGDSRITTVYDDDTGTEITDMTHPEDTPFYINACAEEEVDEPSDMPTLAWNWYILFNSNFKYTSHVIKIEAPTGVTIYHTLDERFIPDTIASKAFVANKITEAQLDGGDAVKKSGDTMTGQLIMGNHSGVKGDTWTSIAFYDSDGNSRGNMMISDANTWHVNVKETGATYADRYLLPTPTANKTEDSWYDILTTKAAVTVAQGGTGATTAADALANLGGVNKSGDTMTGSLTVGNTLILKSNNGYPKLDYNDQDGNIIADIYSADSHHRIAIRSYAMDSDFSTAFWLPAPTTGLTANDSYNILTTKAAVTVAQGGTGKTSLTSGQVLVGNGTGAVTTRAIATSATSGSTSLITSGAVYTGLSGKLDTSGGTLTGTLTVPAPLSITHSSTPSIYLQNSSGTTVGCVACTASTGRVSLRCYATDTSYYAYYQLPAAPTGLTANKGYAILTTQAAVTVGQGGTGSTNGATGLKNLLAAGNTVLSSYQYGTSLPSAGTAGRIFFKKV